MNVEELMLGDWVYGYDGEWKPVCVKQIMGFHPSIVAVHTYGYQPDQIKPIPITPEILEKNGFEEFDGWRILDMDDVEIRWIGTILEISGSHGNMELPNVQCVHEMQHALRLAGIDKEIII